MYLFVSFESDFIIFCEYCLLDLLVFLFIFSYILSCTLQKCFFAYIPDLRSACTTNEDAADLTHPNILRVLHLPSSVLILDLLQFKMPDK